MTQALQGNVGRTLRNIPLYDDRRLIRLVDVLNLLCISKTTFYTHFVTRADFPKPLKVGGILRWRYEELIRWIDSRCEESQSD